jgi:ABC-type multidrug transport system fused ATPase/permease subunit
VKGSGYIVHINSGCANLHGTPDELRQSSKLTSIFESEEDIHQKEDIEHSIKTTLSTSNAEVKTDEKKARALVEEESRATGMVKIRLYKLYIKMIGGIAFWLVMTTLIFGSRGLDVAESWWIKQWSHSYDILDKQTNTFLIKLFNQQSFISQSKQPVYSYSSLNLTESATKVTDAKDDSLDYYLRVYLLITMSNIAVSTARFAVLYWGVLRANKALYVELLRRVFRAPLRFFDTTPIGRILNRFSKDFETIDSDIPDNFLNFVIQWVIIISGLMTVSSVLPIFLVPMLIVAIVNIYLGVMYVSTSRELKRMESVSRSPLFSNFTETIVGVATIRSFGVTSRFMQDMLRYIDINTRSFYYTW